MFGGRRNSRGGRGESLSSVVTPENPPKKSGGGSVTGFDPEGLERAAKAARELDASRNASSAIELIKTQEVTKQVGVSTIFFLLNEISHVFTNFFLISFSIISLCSM